MKKVLLLSVWMLTLCVAVKVRLNAGPFVGLSSPVSFGTALETGVEYHNYYVGVSWLQNIINENCARLHFSIGYKFAL